MNMGEYDCNIIDLIKSKINQGKTIREISIMTKTEKWVIVEIISRNPSISNPSNCFKNNIDVLGINNNSKNMKKKRKPIKNRKKTWKKIQFPSTQSNKRMKYYCADCGKPNPTYDCKLCKRKCWKWCKIHGYHSNHHKCFCKLKKIII